VIEEKIEHQRLDARGEGFAFKRLHDGHQFKNGICIVLINGILTI